MKRLLLLIALGLGALLSGTSARAQASGPDQGNLPRPNLVSTNPIAAIFEFYSAEFEHSLTPIASIAITGSHFGIDDFDYNNVDAIIRYYPGARAIRGFAFGGSVGYARVDDACYGCGSRSRGAFAIGVRGDYVWILGSDQRFAVAAGAGAKRLFYSSEGDRGSTALPIARLSVGYAW